ncbi:hypothetical protein [Candidatus Magnetomonas plexicatena]|uniref:hypothetical protein n=1 Tax=Candidatus Magnetomonas plexicatena TaxID=2552947 RepID=UPI00110438DC|nr:hypothetical protein E2O03_013210 [Nitrospirales bacterium LBB_01]
MEWNFTPFEVLAGKVIYTLEQYRADLREDVAETLSALNLDETSMEFYNNFVFVFFYWIATNQSILSYKKLVEQNLPEDSPVRQALTDMVFLESMKQDNENLIDMLRALMAMFTVNCLKSGSDIEQAKKDLQLEIGFARTL